MKNNMSSLDLFTPKVILPAVFTVMLVAFGWKYNFESSLQACALVALLLGFIDCFPQKTALFFTFALLAPTTSILIKHRIQRLSQDQEYFGVPVSIQGTIIGSSPSYDKNISTSCTIAVDFILYKKKKYFLKKNVHLFLPAKIRIKNHEKIFLKDVIINAPPLGSYKIFCLHNDIWGIVHARYKDYQIQKTAESRNISVFDRVLKKLSLRTKILFDLVFLGKKDRGYITQTIQHQSLFWGTSHIIARSGLHLSIIFLLIFCILAALPIAYRYKMIINLVAIVIFFISTPYSTSFNRAFLMIAAYLLAQIHNVLPNSQHLLLVITLLILLHNPLTCLFLSFQLSFGITYIIIRALSSPANKKHCFKK
jgi:ComEC/Rec2-related protein